MRKLMLLMLVLASFTAAFLSTPPASVGGCVAYCTSPNACGYVCCYQRCCDGRCVFLDCAPPPPCEGES